jgi:alkylresorcinol/alkylpyrone synthase
MPHLIAIKSVLPKNSYSQHDITEYLVNLWPQNLAAVARRIHKAAQVKRRHLALDIEIYERLNGIGERMHLWHEISLTLGLSAVSTVLEESGIDRKSIGHFFFTSVTGMSAPSIDALVSERLKLNPAIKRSPIFGLGCLGGAALLSRAMDYTRAFPKEAALVLSVELCSLTWQSDDHSMANIVATSLFGDGAAALLVVGDEHELAYKSRAQLLNSAQVLFPHSKDLMGWEIKDSGFKVILSPGVPEIAGTALPVEINRFLTKHELQKSDIKNWIAHPGGPKVINAFIQGMEIPEKSLKHAEASLAEIGNLSSASVLHVLEKTLVDPQASYGLMYAMGPGFQAEMVLLTC